jgi:hypothetical protein
MFPRTAFSVGALLTVDLMEENKKRRNNLCASFLMLYANDNSRENQRL